MNPIEAILNLGSIAGLITIFHEVHQSKRNRLSFAFTQASYATINIQDGRHPHRCDRPRHEVLKRGGEHW